VIMARVRRVHNAFESLSPNRTGLIRGTLDQESAWKNKGTRRLIPVKS
jgi:hypothetical protein